MREGLYAKGCLVSKTGTGFLYPNEHICLFRKKVQLRFDVE